jgi:carbon storage regulator CsrA
MLVLSRKAKERIIIRVVGMPDIIVSINEVGKGVVRMGFDAPATVQILREELADEIDAWRK